MIKFKIFLSIIIFVLIVQPIFSQINSIKNEDIFINNYLSEDSTIKLGIDALVYIHYEGIEARNRPKCALFYFTENGTFEVKTSHSWELKNASNIILNTVSRYYYCKLQKEQTFKELDVDWLKKQLLINCENSLANFIYYDDKDSIGYFRTYHLTINNE